jgi:energy-coupling factor transport system permease protein
MEAKRFSNERSRTYYYEFGYSTLDVVYVLYFVVAAMLAVTVGTYWPYVYIA